MHDDAIIELIKWVVKWICLTYLCRHILGGPVYKIITKIGEK